MGLTITTNWTSEFDPVIMLTPILEATSFWGNNVYRVLPDINKSKTVSKQAELSDLIQNGANCGWNPIGAAALTDYTITTNPIKVNVEQCTDVFDGTSFKALLRKGTDVRDLTGVDEIADALAMGVAKGVDKDLYKYGWFGNAAISSSTQVQALDGWFTDFDGEACVEKITIATTGDLDTDEGYDILVSMYSAQPILKQIATTDKCILVTSTIYDNLLVTYESNGIDSGFLRMQEGGDVTFRGIPVKEQPVWDTTIASLGLSDPHRAVYVKNENLVIGTNIAVDPMVQSKVYYKEQEETYDVKTRFDFGISHVFCEYIVYAR